MRCIPSLVAAASLFLTAVAAQAAIIFTADAIAQDGFHGYTAGQSYTFTLTLNPVFVSDSNNSASYGILYDWTGQESNGNSLWAIASGSGVASSSGSFTSSRIAVLRGNQLNLRAFPSGLTSLDGARIESIELNMLVPAGTFTQPTGTVNPNDYFQSYVGQSFGGSGGITLIVSPNPRDMIELSFSITSLSISAGAVPEPSTAALLIGAGTFMLASTRRRFRKE